MIRLSNRLVYLDHWTLRVGVGMRRASQANSEPQQIGGYSKTAQHVFRHS